MPFWYFVLLVGTVLGRSSFGAGPVISLEPGTPPRIEALGEPGQLVTIEAATALHEPWDLLTSVILTNTAMNLPDWWAGSSSTRFYRITRSDANNAPFAQNFRLIDHFGKSRELHYYWHAEEIKAFVLIFTANGCQEIEHQLPAIQALRQKFESQGVVFWMINSNPGDSRTSIAAEATRLGINFPIFHDRAQTTARLYNAGTAAEVVCIDRENMAIFYRGALNNTSSPTASPVARNYAEDALTAFLNDESNPVRGMKATGCDVPVQSAADLSYIRDIAPILQAKCVSCHTPGNIAPWAMTNHTIVQAYAAAMIEQVSTRKMPPWHADPEFGKFKNDFSLSIEDERKLIQWLAAGAPRGEGPDPLVNIPPPPPKWPSELGEPDLIIRAPEQRIKARGEEPYRYIFVETGLKSDVWVKAAIVRPSNPKVVHHYLVWEGASATQLAIGIAGYVPGTDRGAFPEGTGVLLHADTPVLTFNLHYTPSGEEAVDQPELALWFHKTPPNKSLITVPVLPLPLNRLQIPAHAREHEMSLGLPFGRLTRAGTLYALTPHMHVRGKRMRFEVIYPDNRRETLLSVPDYSFHWQATYQLAEPKKIPAGSDFVVTAAYDNSHLNHHNPDPGKTVTWGEQSWEEMFIGYMDFTED